ncbi:biotin-independent malonate decarboxylase subunit beta [Streptomyces sp. NBC_00996]|uniref:biotin-independent malonate decarboxylase subunit beta n=1 Tax=Streptomyces sp. NBC_00996 TaxID=2903710 RepID=UPI00386D8DF1|nr:biotin-independent malonate decarboxylase subunit beta [Streptomyces sp. NBC_00996]
MSPVPITRVPVTELTARERASCVLDDGTFRELVDPFQNMISPHLAPQDITPQSDDGVVVARGSIDSVSAVVLAIEGAFQGGGVGEVGGAKIAGALELALREAEAGLPIRPVLFLETGGIRLQEANLGLLAIAEIHAAIAALRRHVPVVGVCTGMIGCFGGMGIAAGLCSHLVLTPQARLGLNGPEVIEQEAGIAELDSADRAEIWRTVGGEQRVAVGLADVLVPDDIEAVRRALREIFRAGPIADVPCRSARIDDYRARLAALDPRRPPDGPTLRVLWGDDEGEGA